MTAASLPPSPSAAHGQAHSLTHAHTLTCTQTDSFLVLFKDGISSKIEQNTSEACRGAAGHFFFACFFFLQSGTINRCFVCFSFKTLTHSSPVRISGQMKVYKCSSKTLV